MKAADTDGCEYTAYVYHEMLMYMGHVKEVQQLTADNIKCLKFTNAEKKMIVKEHRERWDLMHHVIYTAAYVLNPKLWHNLSVLDDRKLLGEI